MIKKIILTVTISFFTLLSSCVKINTLYDNYEQLEEKVLILEGEISQLTSALNSTTQALETATANFNNLQSSSDTQVSQLLSLIANLQDEKDSLEVELELVKDSLAELTDQINNIDVSVQNPNVVNSSEELNVGFSYEITGENQVTLSANIQNSQYQRIYVDYKNIEESNFKSIELSNENFTINLILNNLI